MLSRCYSAQCFLCHFLPMISVSLQIGDPVHRNTFPAMCMVTYCDNSQSNCCSFAFRHPPWLTWVLSGQIGRIIPQRKYNEITKLRQWWQRKLKKSKRLNKQNNNSACASRFSVHLLAVPSSYQHFITTTWNDQFLSLLENGNGKMINFTGTGSLSELGHGLLRSAPT